MVTETTENGKPSPPPHPQKGQFSLACLARPSPTKHVSTTVQSRGDSIETDRIEKPHEFKVLQKNLGYMLPAPCGMGRVVNFIPPHSCHFVSTPAASTASAKGKIRNRSRSLPVPTILRSRRHGRAPPVRETGAGGGGSQQNGEMSVQPINAWMASANALVDCGRQSEWHREGGGAIVTAHRHVFSQPTFGFVANHL